MMSLVSVSCTVQGVPCWDIHQLGMNKKKYVQSFSTTPGQITSGAQAKDFFLFQVEIYVKKNPAE